MNTQGTKVGIVFRDRSLREFTNARAFFEGYWVIVVYNDSGDRRAFPADTVQRVED